MKCSIIIRAYNEARHIGKLLAGLAHQSRVPYEVILVDSGSTDDTVEIARRWGVKIVPIDKRSFTFGRSLNIGCAAASGDILVFVSAHVYPKHRTWLSDLVQPFTEQQVVLSYGKQRGNELNHFSEHQIFAKWFPNESVFPQRSYFCNNANAAIRRSEWEKRPYDESLTGLEDLDWGKKAQADGGWIAYVASAEIIHVHEENWTSVRNRYRREAIAMRWIDKESRFGIFDFATLLPANILSDLWHALLEKKLPFEMKSILLFRYNQMTGTLQGYRGPSELSEELRKRFYFPVSRAEKLSGNQDNVEHEIDYSEILDNPIRYDFQRHQADVQTQQRH